MTRETAASIDALRRYFEAHQAAARAMTFTGFSEAMSAANRAAEELRNLQAREYEEDAQASAKSPPEEGYTFEETK